MSLLRIGIDFDNTIACYDGVFHKAASEKGLIPKEIPTSKGSVRDYLRKSGKEDDWTELQGYIYGARMDLATAYPHFDRFLSLCYEKQIPSFIISHKTRFPYLGPQYDLQKAAKDWLQNQPFPWLPPAFFEVTLKEKLERISKQECTIFIDDLPELLEEKEFPENVLKILFDPNNQHPKKDEVYLRATSWDEIINLLNLSCYGS